MKIEYSFSDLMKARGFTGLSPTDFIFGELAQSYNVHKKTVQLWFKNDRVPKKYMI